MLNTCDSHHGQSMHVRKMFTSRIRFKSRQITHDTINVASDKLSFNAVAIHSMLSDSRQGLFCLAVLPSVFKTITNIFFNRIVNPSLLPIISNNASTRSALVFQDRRTKALSQFKKFEDSDQVLKTQILQNFDEKHCKNPKFICEGYSNALNLPIYDYL